MPYMVILNQCIIDVLFINGAARVYAVVHMYDRVGV